MNMPPRNVQGSDADRAEGGLDVEASFAELDGATSRRLGAEAEAQASQGNQARQNEGLSAVEMLTAPSEEFRYEGP
ncbi:MAG TPA: hypothetical protein VD902_18420 [Symbiobacteriaceae bacterium]|nr:hypothetical protein [Symbiobacteriaceae bacterium]